MVAALLAETRRLLGASPSEPRQESPQERARPRSVAITVPTHDVSPLPVGLDGGSDLEEEPLISMTSSEAALSSGDRRSFDPSDTSTYDVVDPNLPEDEIVCGY